MMKTKILAFECLFGIYFLSQTLFPSYFNILTSFTGFLFISFLQYRFEGFRVTCILPIITQTILFLTSSPFLHPPLFILMYLGLTYFPIYNYPNPTGDYKVGYKTLRLAGITSVGVYYPTKEKTRDVKYSPTHQHWERFADIMRFYADISKSRKLPKFLFKIALSFLEHQYLGVNENSKIIKAENETKTFPAIVFSHGLSANIHLYSALLKEWASNGFIILSVDHDEEIHLDISQYKTEDDYFRDRNVQLNLRKKILRKALDLISDPVKVQELFGDQDATINVEKVFLAGHSFGGATVTELAAEDERVTGGLIALDPWYEPSDEEVRNKPINKPILSLRSSTYDEVPKLKGLILGHVKANEENNGGLTVSGLFQNTMHNATTDLTFLMPRELILFGMLKSMEDVEHLAVSQSLLTKMFLKTAMEFDGNLETGESLRAVVLERFRDGLEKVGKKDTLLVDGEKIKLKG